MKRNWNLDKYKTRNQATLFGKTFSQLDMEQVLRARINAVELEIARIQHALKCDTCKFEMVLDVERYGGRRTGWYLDVTNSEYLEEAHPDCPKVADYEIGWYGNDLQEGTFDFIRDRLTWARYYYQDELKALNEQLETTVRQVAWLTA